MTDLIGLLLSSTIANIVLFFRDKHKTIQARAYYIIYYPGFQDTYKLFFYIGLKRDEDTFFLSRVDCCM